MLSLAAPLARCGTRAQVHAASAWFFVTLVLLIGGERRLADAHYNVHSFSPALENDERLDADEIRTRLCVSAGPSVPILAAAAATPLGPALRSGTRPRGAVPEAHSPRAPPR